MRFRRQLRNRGQSSGPHSETIPSFTGDPSTSSRESLSQRFGTDQAARRDYEQLKVAHDMEVDGSPRS